MVGIRHSARRKIRALYRNGGAAGEASGEVLTVATGKGDVITFVPAGETIPAPRRIR